jgi:hypothetical protein
MAPPPLIPPPGGFQRSMIRRASLFNEGVALAGLEMKCRALPGHGAATYPSALLERELLRAGDQASAVTTSPVAV